jgi:acetyltransferase-like isoleucine patch superfamily enzyme
MVENIFFDIKELKACGKNVIIGKTVRIRYPHLVSIGDNCIIDDFTYISTKLRLEGYNHISSGCKIIGGPQSSFVMKPFSTLAPNVVVSAGSDDYVGGIATPFVNKEFKGAVKYGEIILGRHSVIGSGSILLPNVVLKDGASVGALSLVNQSLDEWTLYAGIPAKKIKSRNKREILEFEINFLNNHQSESQS